MNAGSSCSASLSTLLHHHSLSDSLIGPHRIALLACSPAPPDVSAPQNPRATRLQQSPSSFRQRHSPRATVTSAEPWATSSSPSVLRNATRSDDDVGALNLRSVRLMGSLATTSTLSGLVSGSMSTFTSSSLTKHGAASVSSASCPSTSLSTTTTAWEDPKLIEGEAFGDAEPSGTMEDSSPAPSSHLISVAHAAAVSSTEWDDASSSQVCETARLLQSIRGVDHTPAMLRGDRVALVRETQPHHRETQPHHRDEPLRSSGDGGSPPPLFLDDTSDEALLSRLHSELWQTTVNRDAGQLFDVSTCAVAIPRTAPSRPASAFGGFGWLHPSSSLSPRRAWAVKSSRPTTHPSSDSLNVIAADILQCIRSSCHEN